MLHTHKKYLATILAFSALALSGSVYADGNNTDISVTVNPSVSLILSSSSVNMQITPTQSGVYDSNSLTVAASTNNTTGYTLVMTTSSPDLVSNTLNFNTNEYPSIPTIAESENGISAADFAASTDSNILNHWGLAIDSGNFNAIKASQTIKTSNTFVTNDTTTLSMASKLDLLTAPGVYSTTLNFQMTANPLPDTLETAYDKAQKQKTTIGGQDYYAIQDMNSSICADVDVIPSTLKVYDNRDNTIYTIGKLADGRCWLLDNLALDLTAANASTSITTSNTNADANSLTSLFSGNRANGAQYATAGITVWESGSSYTAPMIYTEYKNTTKQDDDIEIIRNSKYGIMYNYCAASAGSYCYNGDAGYDRPNTAVDTEYDICPAGWRMPTSDVYNAESLPDGGEYQTLYTAYSNNATNFRSALRLPLSGLFNFTYASGGSQGSYGNYWSATRYGYINMYLLNVGSGDADPYRNFDRDMGLAVRCIAK